MLGVVSTRIPPGLEDTPRLDDCFGWVVPKVLDYLGEEDDVKRLVRQRIWEPFEIPEHELYAHIGEARFHRTLRGVAPRVGRFA